MRVTLVTDVQDVTVELDDGVNYVCFIFFKEPGLDQDGVQFQWPEGSASSKELYIEVGGQQSGAYDVVRAVSLQGQELIVSLAPSKQLPFSALRLDCTGIASELLADAVRKISSAFHSGSALSF